VLIRIAHALALDTIVSDDAHHCCAWDALTCVRVTGLDPSAGVLIIADHRRTLRAFTCVRITGLDPIAGILVVADHRPSLQAVAAVRVTGLDPVAGVVIVADHRHTPPALIRVRVACLLAVAHNAVVATVIPDARRCLFAPLLEIAQFVGQTQRVVGDALAPTGIRYALVHSAQDAVVAIEGHTCGALARVRVTSLDSITGIIISAHSRRATAIIVSSVLAGVTCICVVRRIQDSCIFVRDVRFRDVFSSGVLPWVSHIIVATIPILADLSFWALCRVRTLPVLERGAVRRACTHRNRQRREDRHDQPSEDTCRAVAGRADEFGRLYFHQNLILTACNPLGNPVGAACRWRG
jgi:hypothetical protein